jgi:hypothetical protein
MMGPAQDELPRAIKDPDAEHPLADPWRAAFREIVRAFVQGNYSASHIPQVRSIEPETADRMRAYVESYGATLVDLPDQSWQSSVAQWMGTHWEVIVDLWTAEEGRSDLALHARVFEVGDNFEIQVEGVWVP